MTLLYDPYLPVIENKRKAVEGKSIEHAHRLERAQTDTESGEFSRSHQSSPLSIPPIVGCPRKQRRLRVPWNEWMPSELLCVRRKKWL